MNRILLFVLMGTALAITSFHFPDRGMTSFTSESPRASRNLAAIPDADSPATNAMTATTSARILDMTSPDVVATERTHPDTAEPGLSSSPKGTGPF